MNTKKITIGVLGGVFALTGLASVAYGTGERNRLSEEVRESVKASFENKDYTAYTSIASSNEFKRTMSEEQFATKAERFETKQAAKVALLDNDYDAWRAAIGEERANDVNESNFSLLVNLVEARDAENEEAITIAKEALKEAGLKKPRKKGHGKRGGHGNQKGNY